MILHQLDQLPTLPSEAVRVLQVTTGEDASAGDVVAIISSDQSLCAKILSLAGRASLGGSRGVETVHQAVVLLGFDAVRHAVLSIKVFETFETGGGVAGGRFDRQAFWKHSLAVGCACHLIAERWPGHVDPEVAFVCGLLHDIGKVALDACLPKSYDRVARLASDRHVGIIDVEQEILGVDHTVAGKRLAQRWKLPTGVTECVWLHHHTPDMLPDGLSNPDLVQIVNLANTWAREQGLGSPGALLDGPSSAQIAAQMSLPAEYLAGIAPLLLERVEQRAQIIGLNALTSGEMYAQAAASANAEMGRLAERLASCNQRLESNGRTLKAIQRLHGATHEKSSLEDICRAAAAAFLELGAVERAIAFTRSTGSDLCHLGWAGTKESGAEVFAWSTARAAGQTGSAGGGSSDTDTLFSQSVLVPAPSAVAGLVERFRDQLGPPPHWFLPVVSGGRWCGGIMLSADSAETERLRRCSAELTMFCAVLASFFVAAHDRLETERLNEGLAHVNRKLKAAQEELCRTRSLAMVAEMAAGAAHELNNPLAVVSGRAELLAGRTGDDKMKKGLEIIIFQAERCSGIVSELMEFAKPNRPQKQRIRLSGLLEQVARDWGANSALLPEQLVLEISDAGVAIEVDAEQIQNMFTELLKNAEQACDAAQARLKINCTADSADDVAVVRIEDNGCGMSAEVLEKAMDPFFSHKVSGRGRGLGLSRAFRWCEINGGQMRIESTPDHGTRVWVKFPASGGADS